MKALSRLCSLLFFLQISANAQVNSGSNGSDGALNPVGNLVINMADRPDGIYHYTSVNIPEGVTVKFIPNTANTPIIWLVQGSVILGGTIDISGSAPTHGAGGLAGPGGYSGGVTSGAGNPAGTGLGPGGGQGYNPYLPSVPTAYGGNASFATTGGRRTHQQLQAFPGEMYGNIFLFPLVGGSGGGGGGGYGGCGGGGAMLIAASNEVRIMGQIIANGGGIPTWQTPGSNSGAGSGGGVRIVSRTLTGHGSINALGGSQYWTLNTAGTGRIRLDIIDSSFSGSTQGVTTTGFQPIILPPSNHSINLAIQSVAGVDVANTPTGQLVTPDVIIPPHQQNPVSIVVRCTNIPLNTEIIVDVKPANGEAIRAAGLNTTGTQASSTATVQVQMPRGGGTIQAKAVSGLQLAANHNPNAEHLSIAQTGWTADGERFAKVEVTASLGGKMELAYLTESGKRYMMPAR